MADSKKNTTGRDMRELAQQNSKATYNSINKSTPLSCYSAKVTSPSRTEKQQSNFLLPKQKVSQSNSRSQFYKKSSKFTNSGDSAVILEVPRINFSTIPDKKEEEIRIFPNTARPRITNNFYSEEVRKFEMKNSDKKDIELKTQDAHIKIEKIGKLWSIWESMNSGKSKGEGGADLKNFLDLDGKRDF